MLRSEAAVGGVIRLSTVTQNRDVPCPIGPGDNIYATTSAGSALPPARWVSSDSTWGRSRRVSVRGVICERLGQGGMNSGRNVRRLSIAAVGDWSSSSPRYSRVDG
jgi:hypothetical protein